MEPGSSEQYPVTGQETMGTNWNMGDSTYIKILAQVAQRGCGVSILADFWSL